MKCQYLIGLLLLAMTTCIKRPSIVPPQEDILYQVESFFAQKPDSALQILDTLNVAVLSEKEQAHYCLLRFKVRDQFFLYDDESDSLLKVAENYFVGSEERFFEAETCQGLSRFAFMAGKGEQIKLDWLQKACQSIEQCKTLDERMVRANYDTPQEQIDIYRNFLLTRLGMCYLDNGYYQNALNCLRSAATYYEERQKSPFGWFQSASMLGNAYLALKEYDSCRMWYGKSLEVAEQMNDPENIAYYHYSMSMYYRYRYDDQDYANETEGKQLLRQAVAECHHGLSQYKGQMFMYKDGLYDELGRLYYQLAQYDSCILYSERRIEFMEQVHFEMVPNYTNAKNLFRLYKSYEVLGDKDKALEYVGRYVEMEQEIQDRPQAVGQVKNDYEQQLEKRRLQHEQQLRRYQHYLLLALAVGALLVVLWMTNRHRKNKEIELLRQEEAYRKLQSEFDAASQHSRQVLQQRMMTLYRTGGNDRLERILAEFAAAYPGAMEKMQAKQPELIEAERNIVVLSFLGFRVKEEADLLGLSVNTVTKYRTNIRKKLGSDSVSNLWE